MRIISAALVLLSVCLVSGWAATFSREGSGDIVMRAADGSGTEVARLGAKSAEPTDGPFAWTTSVVDQLGSQSRAWITSMEVRGPSVHIAYMYFTSSSPLRTEIRYARSTDYGVTWSVELVDSAPNYTGTYALLGWFGIGLALDSAGRPHIAYTIEAPTSFCIRAVRTGPGAWHRDTVEMRTSLPLICHDADIKIDAQDRAHVVYTYYGYQTRYAVQSGDTWIRRDINYGASYGTAICLDSLDRPHIVIGTLNDMRYAFTSDGGTTWVTEIADPTAWWHTDITVGAGNIPMLVYTHGAASAWSARRTGPGTWARYQVDGTGNNVYQPAAFHGRDGRYHATYYHYVSSTVTLRHAVSTDNGQTWTTEVVTANGGVNSSCAQPDYFETVAGRFICYQQNAAYLWIATDVLPSVADVACTKILAPAGRVDSGTAVTPACSLANYGTTAASYTVRMRVGTTYRESSLVTNHAAGTRLYLTFPVSWAALSRGTYPVTCSTELSGDIQPSNDRATDSVSVSVDDIGVAAILAPSGTLEPGTDVLPSARWQNYGSQAEDFTGWCMLTNPSGTRVYAESLAVTDLGPGADTVLDLASFNVGNDTGLWTVRCSTRCLGDIVPANDVVQSTFRVRSNEPPPPGWQEKASVPSPLSGKQVKDGGWLAFDGSTGFIYAAKGNKTADFYCYNPATDSWKALAPVPVGIENKPAGKGGAGTSDGTGLVYALKGNNTLGFYKYDATTDSWKQLKDIPLGTTNKKVKGGGDLVYDGSFVYCLKGYKNEYWRYDVASDSWQSLAAAPAAKYGAGSWLARVDSLIYCHEAKNHSFYAYNLNAQAWGTAKTGMPYIGRTGKSKKSKDGGCAALLGRYVYALKGGNTQEFWRYNPGSDSWLELDTMPQYGSTLKKKKVKAGADITAADYLYALKGNKTFEFWRYVPAPTLALTNLPVRSGVMADKAAGHRYELSLSPRPLATSIVTLRYSLPRAVRATVQVHDAAGRAVVTRSLAAGRSGSTDLDLRSLSAGVYLVKLSAQGHTTTEKLVVER